MQGTRGGAKWWTPSRRSWRSASVTLIVVAGLVAGGLTTLAIPSNADATWSLTPSPSPFRPMASPMSAVSCSSTTSCFAVGTRSDLDDFDYPGVPHLLQGPTLVIERWDGTTWSSVAGPIGSADPGAGRLHGVSCVSASSCVAVGALGTTIYTNTLAENWDGTTWSVVASPNPPDATSSRLDSVSCSSAANCFAVGSYLSGTTTRTLIEQWDGASWTIVAGPNPSAAVSALLSGVSCSSAMSCFAVGSHVDAGTNKGGALVERWDGANWAIVATPVPTVRPVDAPVFTPRLTGVSCSSDTSCVAVGYTASDALIEQWNGASWSLLASPVPRVHLGVAALHAVSCASATDCSAVGLVVDTSLAKKGTALPNSIAEHWDGTTWTILPRPAGVPTSKAEFGQLSNLSGVSCPSATICFSVGNSAMPERRVGSQWSLAPISASTSYSYFNQMACPSPTTCFAVGTTGALLDSGNNTLVERWDGTGWSIVPSPTPSGASVLATLSSISCPSPTNCTAVGSSEAQSVLEPNRGSVNALIEHWNGATWSIVANPKPAKVLSWRMSGVACASATSCNAVGSYATSTRNQLLAEHWNGVRWSMVPIPSPSGAVLNAVTCSSATSCVAVGGRSNAKSSGLALVERWNGTSWSIVPTPVPRSGYIFQLNAVSCSSATDCTAVGNSVARTFAFATERTLVEHWNGKSWSVKASPSPTTSTGLGMALNGVSCSSATSCTAVGNYDRSPDFPPPGKPLIEAWNGTSWSILPTPMPANATSTILNGVTCRGPTSCVAVGGYLNPDGLFTLVGPIP